jgi:hypothetical protein
MSINLFFVRLFLCRTVGNMTANISVYVPCTYIPLLPIAISLPNKDLYLLIYRAIAFSDFWVFY